MSALLRRLFCALGWCLRCRTNEDEHSLWGECIDCGKRHGKIAALAFMSDDEASALLSTEKARVKA